MRKFNKVIVILEITEKKLILRMWFWKEANSENNMKLILFFSRTRRRAAYQYIKKNKGEKSPKELQKKKACNYASQLLQEKETG